MGRFTHFVILAAMRTGSNFLEASLGELPGVAGYGELFNPHFMGRRGRTEAFGCDLAAREADPGALIAAMCRADGGLPGFRLFDGHDPRAREAVIADPACAKIVLGRDPLQSYLSLKIARETDQWLFTGDGTPKTAIVRFDAAEFAVFRRSRDAFYGDVRRRLKTLGQTAFEIDYEDLSDVAVLNGLAAWLGADGRLKAPSARIRRQNPVAIAEKVSNPEDIPPALLDGGGGHPAAVAETEPQRNAAVPSYVAAAVSPLLYLPVRGGPVPRIEAWLAALDGTATDGLLRSFSQSTLADWRGAHPGHRSFTVLRHPLGRAHAVFCAHLLVPGPACFGQIRAQLARHHGIDFPADGPGEGYDAARHRDLFLGFLAFLRRNLAGMTSIRVDPAWASQESVLRGFARLAVPDLVLREDRLEEELGWLAGVAGRPAPALPDDAEPEPPVALAAIYDAEVERAARAAYGRDYLAFGFGDWAGGAALRRP